jgi:hypothetical protein
MFLTVTIDIEGKLKMMVDCGVLYRIVLHCIVGSQRHLTILILSLCFLFMWVCSLFRGSSVLVLLLVATWGIGKAG